jgi:hypothetical protein
MGKTDLGEIHKRFDALSIAIHKVDKTVIKLEEHQRSINGNIIRLQKEANDRSNKCYNQFECLEKKIEANKGSITFAKGTIYSIGFLTTILGLIAIAKSLGLW